MAGLYARLPHASSASREFFKPRWKLHPSCKSFAQETGNVPHHDTRRGPCRVPRQRRPCWRGTFASRPAATRPTILQCARVLMNPDRAARLAIALAQQIPRDLRASIDAVVSPAMGGIIIGHEMGRALQKDAMFLERPEGKFHLRRGFALEKGAKVLMVEDVVTTGLSQSRGDCSSRRRRRQGRGRGGAG